LSQIAIGVLGVLAITSEYDSGMILSSLSAVPRRRSMLAAKVIVFAVMDPVVGLFASYTAYFVFQTFLSDGRFGSSIGDPGVFRAVTGGGLYLATLGLFDFSLGALRCALRVANRHGSVAAFLAADVWPVHSA